MSIAKIKGKMGTPDEYREYRDDIELNITCVIQRHICVFFFLVRLQSLFNEYKNDLFEST